MTFSNPESQLLQYYREQIPAVNDPQIVDFAAISDGWENQVYAFAVVHDGGRDERILRIYPGSDLILPSRQEFDGMRTLFQQGYPVPEVFVYESQGQWFGKPFVIMQKINGRLMGDVIDDAPEREEALIGKFAQLYVELHQMDIEPFLPDGTVPDPNAYLDDLFAQGKAMLGGLGSEAFDATLDWFVSHRDQIACERLSITHGDFHLYNILLDEDEQPFVIDWTQIMPGDYRLDLAWTLLLAGGYGRPHRGKMVLAEYERIAGKPVENLDYFNGLAAFKRLGFITMSLIAGAETLGLRPEATEMIRQQADHVQLVYNQLTSVTGLPLPEVEQLIAALP